jgi:membrane protease YdiL (CAAX protease family)
MADADKPVLGGWSALFAFGALLAGMVFIGGAAQQRSIVAGLWITEVLAIALPAAIALRMAGVRFAPYLGLRKPSARHLLVALVAGALNQPVVSFLTWGAHEALPHGWVQDFDAKQRMLDAIFRLHAVPMVITVVLAAPLGEELFFRGFALPALQKSWGTLGGVLASAVLFSLLHMDPVGFIGLMEIGILLAALRHWSGSLWVAIFGHAVNNGIAGAAFLAGLEDPDIPPPAWLLALGAALLLAGIWALVRVLRKPTPAPAREERTEDPAPVAIGLSLIWVVSLGLGIAMIVGKLRL